MGIAGLKNLCTPSYLYLILSLFLLGAMAFQNFGYANRYCVGIHSCNVPSTIMVFVIKFMYILFWTWILNLICRAGAPHLAWFLFIFPFILLFTLIAMMMSSI